MMNKHTTVLIRPEKVKNVSCIKRFNNIKIIFEELIIMKDKPCINRQSEDFFIFTKFY